MKRGAVDFLPKPFGVELIRTSSLQDHASSEVHQIYQRIGAKDLRPMFEKLATLNAEQKVILALEEAQKARGGGE
jgi:FixJ family two-component response regulator